MTITGEISRFAQRTVYNFALLHVLRMMDIEVHGGHCAELAQGNYLMPRVTCAL